MDCQKDLFTLPDDFHYLNCSYMSPLLKSVEEAGMKGIRAKREPWHTSPEDFFEQSHNLRSLFARLVNAEDSQRIAIVPAVSYGMATVAANMELEAGQNIVIAGEQFPSNVFSWMKKCRQSGASLVSVDPPGGKHRGRRWNERILEAINEDTALVALSHCHWTDGTLFDLEAVGEKARSVGALFALDLTQSLGALPFDVQKVRPDALVSAGYKWLMGPYSIGLAYFGPAFNQGDPLEEGWIVRKGSEDFSGLINYRSDYQPGMLRYDVGERSNFILVPMMAAALQQILDWGVPSIQGYCKRLNEELFEGLGDLGYSVEEPARRAGHILGIRLPENVALDALQQELGKNNISVSVRGSAVRVSPNVYNMREDIGALKSVLKAAVR